MICSGCAADVPDEDLFCENCGAKFPTTGSEAKPTGCSCGAGGDEVDEDGYCLCCGKRVRRPDSDHIEEVLSRRLAAVSDRGLRHDRNEDRFALLQVDGRYGVVVCDGVSSTDNSEMASAIVSQRVAQELTQCLSAEGHFDTAQAIRESIMAASAELRSQTGSGDGSSPSTTVVAALVVGDEVSIGWAGDSRAYWIDAAGANLLTQDHSWLNETLAAGEMQEEHARLAPQAHAITRWIGADAESETEPELVRCPLVTDGTLLLCSDGLWNYVDEPDALLEIVRGDGEEAMDALAIARRLVAFANEQGGRDNVTAAVIHVILPDPEAALDECAEQTGDLERREETKESEHAGSV